MGRNLFIAAISILLCAACGSETDSQEPDFSGAPVASMTLDGGRVRVQVRTSPQPPVKGPADVQLTVSDAETGAPIDGLAIRVTPWMEAHGHGSATVDAKATGEGRYVAEGALFSMAGPWELKLEISGAITETATSPSFDVRP